MSRLGAFCTYLGLRPGFMALACATNETLGLDGLFGVCVLCGKFPVGG